MIKLLIAGRTCPGKTRAAALHYLQTIHGAMVVNPPPDAGEMPRRYVQNHVLDGVSIHGLEAFTSDRDLITELFFEDVGHLSAATRTRFYKEVLQPDESNFVDQTNVMAMIVQEHEEVGVAPPKATKLFVFLKKGVTTDRSDFETVCAATLAALLSADIVTASLLNRPIVSVGDPPPYADLVSELWFKDRAAAERFCRRDLPGAFAALNATLAPGESFYVLADEFTVERLRATRHAPSRGVSTNA